MMQCFFRKILAKSRFDKIKHQHLREQSAVQIQRVTRGHQARECARLCLKSVSTIQCFTRRMLAQSVLHHTTQNEIDGAVVDEEDEGSYSFDFSVEDSAVGDDLVMTQPELDFTSEHSCTSGGSDDQEKFQKCKELAEFRQSAQEWNAVVKIQNAVRAHQKKNHSEWYSPWAHCQKAAESIQIVARRNHLAKKDAATKINCYARRFMAIKALKKMREEEKEVTQKTQQIAAVTKIQSHIRRLQASIPFQRVQHQLKNMGEEQLHDGVGKELNTNTFSSGNKIQGTWPPLQDLKLKDKCLCQRSCNLVDDSKSERPFSLSTSIGNCPQHQNVIRHLEGFTSQVSSASSFQHRLENGKEKEIQSSFSPPSLSFQCRQWSQEGVGNTPYYEKEQNETISALQKRKSYSELLRMRSRRRKKDLVLQREASVSALNSKKIAKCKNQKTSYSSCRSKMVLNVKGNRFLVSLEELEDEFNVNAFDPLSRKTIRNLKVPLKLLKMLGQDFNIQSKWEFIRFCLHLHINGASVKILGNGFCTSIYQEINVGQDLFTVKSFHSNSLLLCLLSDKNVEPHCNKIICTISLVPDAPIDILNKQSLVKILSMPQILGFFQILLSRRVSAPPFRENGVLPYCVILDSFSCLECISEGSAATKI